LDYLIVGTVVLSVVSPISYTRSMLNGQAALIGSQD